MYYGGVFFLILGMSELFLNSKIILSYSVLIFSFLYVGSSSEHVGSLTIVLLSSIIGFKVIFQPIMLKKFILSKVLIALIVCLISFLIMFKAPGNDVRRAHFPEPSFLNSFEIAWNSLKKLIKLLKPKLIGYLMVSMPFLLFGILKRNKLNEVTLFKAIFFGIPFIFIMLYIFMLPTAYAISAMGPKRSLTYISAVLIFISVIFAYHVGKYSRIPLKVGVILSFMSCFYFSIITYQNFKYVLPDSIRFARSEKDRMDYLISLKNSGNKENISVKKRHESNNNIFIDHEISTNPNNWHNECIYNALDLEFKIRAE
jgi:hypothetical protein